MAIRDRIRKLERTVSRPASGNVLDTLSPKERQAVMEEAQRRIAVWRQEYQYQRELEAMQAEDDSNPEED